MESRKGRQKENKEETHLEEEKDLKDRPFGGTKDEKPLKLQENSLLGLCPKKNKNKEKKKPNHPPKKTKITPFYMLANKPHFLSVATFCFSSYTLLFLQSCALPKTL